MSKTREVPASGVRIGDMAFHIDGLDPCMVVRATRKNVWLRFDHVDRTPYGPFAKSNYRFFRVVS